MSNGLGNHLVCAQASCEVGTTLRDEFELLHTNEISSTIYHHDVTLTAAQGKTKKGAEIVSTPPPQKRKRTYVEKSMNNFNLNKLYSNCPRYKYLFMINLAVIN